MNQLLLKLLPPHPPSCPYSTTLSCRCVVVEDSRIGMLAAKAAGMTCVITKSSYTQNEDFSVADAVYDCIGDAGDERFGLQQLEQLLDTAAVSA